MLTLISVKKNCNICQGIKKKKKHKKKSKRKHGSISSIDSELDSPSSKKRKIENLMKIECEVLPDDTKSKPLLTTRAENEGEKETKFKMGFKDDKDPGSPKLPPISHKILNDDEDDELGPGNPRFIGELIFFTHFINNPHIFLA